MEETRRSSPYVTIIGHPNADMHHGVVSFNVNGIHPHDVASILDMDQVAIRAGHHCAQPLLTWLGVENLACCRASLAFYNDKGDVDKLVGWPESTFGARSMANSGIYTAALMDHNAHPDYKYEMDDATR